MPAAGCRRRRLRAFHSNSLPMAESVASTFPVATVGRKRRYFSLMGRKCEQRAELPVVPRSHASFLTSTPVLYAVEVVAAAARTQYLCCFPTRQTTFRARAAAFRKSASTWRLLSNVNKCHLRICGKGLTTRQKVRLAQTKLKRNGGG